MELPENEVHQCSNGHNFCGECLTKHRASGHSASSKCPTCRTSLDATAVRNRDAERRIGCLPGNCEGCGSEMLRSLLGGHVAVCQDVKVACPFPGCHVRVPRRELAAHMAAAQDEHIQLAQAQHKRLQTAEDILARVSVSVDVSVCAVPGNTYERAQLLTCPIDLKLMEPIDGQLEFMSFFHAHDLDRELCTVSVDTSKTPFDLNLLDNSASITVSIPDDLVPDRLRRAHDSSSINLKVVTEEGTEIFFKCKMTTTFDKLMAAFFSRNAIYGAARETVAFIFDGIRIRPTDTPTTHDMEDGDVIDVQIISADDPSSPGYRIP